MMLDLRGRIATGFGQGSYYIKNYSDKIKELLEFTPFPGTLNIVVGSGLPDLSSDVKHQIHEFSRDGKEFGKIGLIPAKVCAGEQIMGCYVVLPEKTRHTGVVELISEFNLRNKLGLSEGDEIKILLV